MEKHTFIYKRTQLSRNTHNYKATHTIIKKHKYYQETHKLCRNAQNYQETLL